MKSLFEKNLERMSSELTDLKCAQKRGLGTIRFYTKTLEVNLPANVSKTITVTYAAQDFVPGVVELSGGSFYAFWIIKSPTSTTRTLEVLSGTAQTVTFLVTSSIPLVSLEVS